jgi:hypothetical protein
MLSIILWLLIAVTLVVGYALVRRELYWLNVEAQVRENLWR